mmetsp:Transcript_1123/g.1527  ORF Transcript_1123/g.1527 Transcript_1123/m.1527 type:complete len:402 (-) Transcript_1123:1925-3130(-)
MVQVPAAIMRGAKHSKIKALSLHLHLHLHLCLHTGSSMSLTTRSLMSHFCTGTPANTTPPPHFTYRFGSSLYIPLTSQCNSMSLPMTRGGTSFLKTLSPAVLKSLALVRAAEIQNSDDFECYEYEYDNSNNSNSTFTDDNFINKYLFDEIEKKQEEKKETTEALLLPYLTHQEQHRSLLSLDDDEFDNYQDGFYPSIQALYHEIQTQTINKMSEQNDSTCINSIVFAGEGEPTLRINAIIVLSKYIRQHFNNKEMPIRVITNGLFDYGYYGKTRRPTDDLTLIPSKEYYNVLENLKQAGVNSLCVALGTSCSTQYEELMKPETKVILTPSSSVNSLNINMKDETLNAHETVCKFIQNAIAMGFDVEVTGVDHDVVDKMKAEQLAKNLGVSRCFRWRSYYAM